VSRPGFSLLEITFVLVIIGLLMGVAAVGLVGAQERASIRTTKATMTTYKNAIQSFMGENAGNAPADLAALVTAKYIEAQNGQPPTDAWDKQLYYQPTPGVAQPFALKSAGPNKTFGDQDDIDVWTMDVRTGT
jgi:type II secretion system protein G